MQVISLGQPLGRNTRLPESGERRANAEEHEDPQNRNNERQDQSARFHKSVEQKNVHNDGRQQRQGEWHETVYQEQNGGHQLEQEHNDQKMRDEKGSDELAGRPGGRWHGDEVKEAVESEDQKYESKEETGDDSGNLHGSLLDTKYIDINILAVK